MPKSTNRTLLDLAGKINSLEILEKNNEVRIMKIGEDEKIDKEVRKNASTSWTRVKMLEIIAWYLVPAIYIIFTVTYFTLYSML